MKKMHVNLAKEKLIANLIFSICLLASCIILLFIKDVGPLNNARFVLVLGFFYYAFGIWSTIVQMTNGKLLIIDDRGIDVQGNYGIGFIPWDEIQEVYTKRAYGHTYLELKLKDEKKTLSRIINAKGYISNKKMGHEALMFDIAYFDQKIEDVIAYINKARENYHQEVYAGGVNESGNI